MRPDSMESCVPPGFRFHPTDEELVGYYLKKKVASQKIDLDVIRDIDLYRIEPWDLQETCGMGYEEQNEWYFFSHKDKKYPTGTRTNRATMAGFWKATGRDKAVYDKCKLVGKRKTLVFYKGRAPNGQKTDWIMHEYRLESDEDGPPQEEGWVVCRAFKKKASMQSKNMEGWESSYVYDEASGVSSVIDPIHDYAASRQQHTLGNRNGCLFPKKLLCKREIESEAALANLMHYSSASVDSFLQLPQLESPNNSQIPSLLKRVVSTSSISLVSQNNNLDNKLYYGTNNNNNNNNDHTDQNSDDYAFGDNKVTDWRALDKFVASQLSQVDPTSVDDQQDLNRQRLSSSYNNDHHSGSSTTDMEVLLLLHQSNELERDQDFLDGSKLIRGFLNSTSVDTDNIGVCMFNKTTI